MENRLSKNAQGTQKDRKEESNRWVLKVKFYVVVVKTLAQCLKIPQKVSFNIASEASYVYIIKVDKTLLKMPKIWKPEAWGQTVLPDRTKIGEKCQKVKRDILIHFQTLWVA